MQLILEYVLRIENILDYSYRSNFQVEQSTLQPFISGLSDLLESARVGKVISIASR